ncbi:MAG: DUF47 family protein [Chloroflexota bacterium]
MKLFSFLIPKEDRFFGLLKSSASNLYDTSKAMVDLMEDYRNVPEKAAEIKQLEEVGDLIIHQIMNNLHRTFVTPLDREDIAALGEHLDDVVDALEEAARHFVEYGIQAPTPACLELSNIIVASAEMLQQALAKIHFKGSKLKGILADVVEINRLENEADHVTSAAMAQLFTNQDISAIDVMKWRDIYNQLEQAADRCEDAANVLEGIVLKNA